MIWFAPVAVYLMAMNGMWLAVAWRAMQGIGYLPGVRWWWVGCAAVAVVVIVTNWPQATATLRWWMLVAVACGLLFGWLLGRRTWRLFVERTAADHAETTDPARVE